MKTILSLLATFALSVAFSITTPAQTCPGSPGCLDPTFGTGGMNVISPPLADDPLYNGTMDMVFQNDGKIVILARAQDIAGTFRNVLVRYTADGQLDATFATGGILYVSSNAPIGSFARQLLKQTINGQERFVLAVLGCNGVNCLKAQRFTNDGDLDTSFGTGGVATVPGEGCTVNAAAVQSDQKIVLGCMQKPLIRLNANGTPDSSFGLNGIATFNDSRMLVTSMFVLPDGKILTGGGYIGGNSPDLYVARFTSNGRSDGSFGTQGKRVIDFAGMDDSARAIAVDSTGKILAVGWANIAGPMSANAGWDAVIVRLTSKGVLDKTFGTNGKAAPLNIGNGEDEFRKVAIQSNGKIVVTGLGSLAGNSSDILVARYNANGTLDTTFHGDGWNLTDIYGSADRGNAGLIQFDPGCSCSKLVVAGTAQTGALNLFPQYIAGLRYSL